MTTKKALTTGLFIAVAIGAGVAGSSRIWQIYGEQQRKARVQTAEMRASEARRAELLRQEADAKSSIGREELARKQGFLRPGEIPAGD